MIELPDVLMTEVTYSVESLLAKIRAYDPKADLDLVRLAFEFADDAHRGQVRASGLPYIVHPLRTAEILAEVQVPVAIIIAGLLHDVPEDTAVTLADVEKNFGADVASMVAGVTKLGTIKYRGLDRYIENLRKMFVAMASDVRVILIKFADRIHNLETLDALKPEKRLRIALESLEIYAPIANRLGLGQLRVRLEDLSFRHVMPSEYEWTKDLSEQAIAGKSEYIERLRHEVERELTDAGVPFLGMTGRVKHLYSLYKKLLNNDRDIVQIHDLVALRIMVPDVGACYAALGIIHQRWKPLKGLIKDYIALPKPNGYRSLHTTVFCEEGEVVEFQIRTPEMHSEAERGIAAHWRYDEAGKRSLPQPVHGGELSWVKELGELEGQQHDNGDLADRLDSLKIDAFQNRIFVLTPSGDVIDLPEGATPVDFAYAIHSNIGDKMSGARVNDDIVSVETPLASGDCCEIIIDKNRKGPNPDWLEFVKTSHARDRIRAYAKAKTAQWISSMTDEKVSGKR